MKSSSTRTTSGSSSGRSMNNDPSPGLCRQTPGSLNMLTFRLTLKPLSKPFSNASEALSLRPLRWYILVSWHSLPKSPGAARLNFWGCPPKSPGADRLILRRKLGEQPQKFRRATPADLGGKCQDAKKYHRSGRRDNTQYPTKTLGLESDCNHFSSF
jgi:hypothetical protein